MKKPPALATAALGVFVGAHQVFDASVVHPGHPEAPRPPKASVVVASTSAAAFTINTTSGAEHNLVPPLSSNARSS
jgi:hypothetical protein